MPDLIKVHELEGKIMSCLSKESEHEVEGDLLEILNFDNFELIKVLKLNWHMIYYLTLLAKSTDKEQTRWEILETENGPKILKMIEQQTEDGLKIDIDFNKPVQSVKDISAFRSRVLDLDKIAFEEGIEAKEVNLPPGSKWV